MVEQFSPSSTEVHRRPVLPSATITSIGDLFFLCQLRLAALTGCIEESGEERSKMESVYALKCHISHEVNHFHEGLKHAMKLELEKASPSLGRSAIYIKDSCINGLLRYLTIQFVRFFWKRESNQKAKILRVLPGEVGGQAPKP
ncbi:hypothetical protein ACSBR2_023465 [Camellia fascicularis]